MTEATHAEAESMYTCITPTHARTLPHTTTALTESAAGADPVEDDVGGVRMVQDLEELVHHDGEGRHPDPVLQPEKTHAGQNGCGIFFVFGKVQYFIAESFR